LSRKSNQVARARIRQFELNAQPDGPSPRLKFEPSSRKCWSWQSQARSPNRRLSRKQIWRCVCRPADWHDANYAAASSSIAGFEQPSRVAVRGSASCSALSGSMRPEPKLSSRSPDARRWRSIAGPQRGSVCSKLILRREVRRAVAPRNDIVCEAEPTALLTRLDAILHSTSVLNGACMVVTDAEPDRLAKPPSPKLSVQRFESCRPSVAVRR
jgi:hypothetical protein